MNSDFGLHFYLIRKEDTVVIYEGNVVGKNPIKGDIGIFANTLTLDHGIYKKFLGIDVTSTYKHLENNNTSLDYFINSGENLDSCCFIKNLDIPKKQENYFKKINETLNRVVNEKYTPPTENGRVNIDNQEINNLLINIIKKTKIELERDYLTNIIDEITYSRFNFEKLKQVYYYIKEKNTIKKLKEYINNENNESEEIKNTRIKVRLGGIKCFQKEIKKINNEYENILKIFQISKIEIINKENINIRNIETILKHESKTLMEIIENDSITLTVKSEKLETFINNLEILKKKINEET